jgi:hypothetical protein
MIDILAVTFAHKTRLGHFSTRGIPLSPSLLLNRLLVV